VNQPSTATPVADQYAAARSTAAVHILQRDVVSVSGADAEPYLQGQCSQDVAGLRPGATTDSLLLSPQGKIDAFIRVSRSGDGGFVIDADPGSGPAVVARLERFRLRMKVEIRLLDGWVCVAVRGPGASDAVVGSPPFVLPVDWPGLAGLDLLGAAPSELARWVEPGAVPCGDEAWEALRIEAGIPIGGRDALEGSIPAETGLVERTVSFTKGCFTGQELVARLDARGSKVARRLRGVVVLTVAGDHGPEDLPAVGSAVLTADGAQEVGQLTSVAWSPGLRASVALAMLHRRVEPPDPVLLRSAPGDETWPAEARSLPLFA
jgi:folate-binding protein YgfZ